MSVHGLLLPLGRGCTALFRVGIGLHARLSAFGLFLVVLCILGLLAPLLLVLAVLSFLSRFLSAPGSIDGFHEVVMSLINYCWS